MFKKYVFGTFFILILTHILFAENSGKIIFVSGGDFSIVRNEERTNYDSEETVIDLPILEGDTILTETGTLVEIQLKKTGTVLLIAENTTFTFSTLYDNGGGLFHITYGRIRAIVNKLNPNTEFYIQGSDTVAGVRGTDFGYDLLFDKNGKNPEKRSTVYCFNGEVSVLKREYSSENSQYYKMADNKNILNLNNNEMVRTSSLYPEQKLNKEPISQEIVDFWKNIPLITISNPENSTPGDNNLMNPSEEEITEKLSLEKYSKKEKLQITGATLFGMGATAITTGVLIYMFAPENRVAGQVASGFGAGLSTMGLSFFITSLFYDEDGNPKYKKESQE